MSSDLFQEPATLTAPERTRVETDQMPVPVAPLQVNTSMSTSIKFNVMAYNHIIQAITIKPVISLCRRCGNCRENEQYKDMHSKKGVVSHSKEYCTVPQSFYREKWEQRPGYRVCIKEQKEQLKQTKKWYQKKLEEHNIPLKKHSDLLLH